MSERSSRRQFLGKASVITGAAATAGVATELHAHRAFSEVHPITPEKLPELRDIATSLVEKKLVRVGKFSPVEAETQWGKKKIRPVLNPQGVAESLVYMSYMEGGDSNTHRMVDFLQENNGIEVRQGDNGTASTTHVDFFSFDNNVTVTLGSDILLSNTRTATLGHEFYHVEQQARDKGVDLFIERVLGYAEIVTIVCGLGISSGSVYENLLLVKEGEGKKFTKEEKRFIKRRKLLVTTVGGAAGAVISNMYHRVFSPIERQASVEGGYANANSYGELASQEPIRSALESIVTFELVQ